MNNLSKEDIEFIKLYQDQSVEGSYDDYYWEYNPQFDISLMGDSTDWISWIEDERKYFVEEFEYDRYKEIENWWLKTPDIEPLIVIQQEDGEYSTWDGAHRVGISFFNNIKFVPAFVGINKVFDKK